MAAPPPFPPILPPPPQRPGQPVPQCNFCCEVTTFRNQFKLPAPSYCPYPYTCQCVISPSSIVGIPIQNDYALQIYKNIVVGIERQGRFGILLDRVNKLYGARLLAPFQRDRLIAEINQGIRAYEDVIIKAFTRPPFAANEWADVYNELIKFAAGIEARLSSRLDTFIGPEQQEQLRKYCSGLSINWCGYPCNRVEGFLGFGEGCEYRSLPK